MTDDKDHQAGRPQYQKPEIIELTEPDTALGLCKYGSSPGGSGCSSGGSATGGSCKSGTVAGYCGSVGMTG
jgi:hypothetical protein